MRKTKSIRKGARQSQSVVVADEGGYKTSDNRIDQQLRRYSPAKLELLRENLKKYVGGTISIKFIKAVFYPEYFTARIPYNLTNVSTAIVSHVEQFVINSGPKGEGMLFYFPKTTNGPAVYTYLSGEPTGGSHNLWKVSFYLTGKDTVLGYLNFPVQISDLAVYSLATVTLTRAIADYDFRWTVATQVFGVDTTQTHPMFFDAAAASTPQSLDQLLATNSVLSPTLQNVRAGGISYVGGSPLWTKSADSQYTAGWGQFARKDYSTFYEKAALVGACLTMEYVGRAEYDSGFLVGSQLQDIPIDTVTTYDIEHGQNVVNTRPFEGLRMTYMPYDQSDFEMYGTGSKDSTNYGARAVTKTSQTFDAVIKAPEDTSKLTTGIAFNRAAPCVAIYWKGLYPNQDTFRIGLSRRFNMVPAKIYKDIVDTHSPDLNIDPTATMNRVFKLARAAPLGGATLAEAEAMQLVRSNFANAAVMNDDARYRSLGDFGSALALSAGGE